MFNKILFSVAYELKLLLAQLSLVFLTMDCTLQLQIIGAGGGEGRVLIKRGKSHRYLKYQLARGSK